MWVPPTLPHWKQAGSKWQGYVETMQFDPVARELWVLVGGDVYSIRSSAAHPFAGHAVKRLATTAGDAPGSLRFPHALHVQRRRQSNGTGTEVWVGEWKDAREKEGRIQVFAVA